MTSAIFGNEQDGKLQPSRSGQNDHSNTLKAEVNRAHEVPHVPVCIKNREVVRQLFSAVSCNN